MNTGTPNQELAAIWIARAFRDYRNAMTEIAAERSNPQVAHKMLKEANIVADDVLAQFTALMGDELRVVENMNKISLPLNIV